LSLIQIDKSYNLFYLIFGLFIVAIFFSNPFLKIPYDMWYHLSRVEYFFSHDVFILEVKNKELWPYIWGGIFKIFGIEDVLFRAKIIHIVQALISFFVIYFTSKVVIQNLFRKIDALALKYLSLWSTIIWFTIYATFSVAYHQVWIMWYSINYQITLIMFWYIFALSLLLVAQKQSLSKSLLHLFQIIFFSIVILWMHAIEFIYYAMYLFLICLIYWRQIFTGFKTYYIQSSFVLLTLFYGLFYFFTHDFVYRKPKIFQYLSFEHIDELYSKLMTVGKIQVEISSRAFASLNELIYILLFVIVIMLILKVYHYLQKMDDNIDGKVFVLLATSSFFVLIPINIFASGLASMLVSEVYVNRYYYASSVFMVLPIAVYYFMQLYMPKKRLLKTNFVILSILVLVFVYSKQFSQSSNYYKNIVSLSNSFSKEKVGLNYSMKYVNIIDKELQNYKHKFQDKKVLYYARGDIAYILQYIFKKDNVYMHRRHTYSKEEFLIYCEKNSYTPVVFKTPNNFPKDELIFENFDFEMK